MNAIGLIITYKILATFNALDQVSFNLKVGLSLHSTIII